LPIKYSDLPVSSQLAITIWDSAGPRKQVPFGGTTYSIFNPSDKSSPHATNANNRTLRTGHQKLKLWIGKEADGLSETSTPGTFTSTTEMDRLEKLVKRHEQGDLPRLDWLDNLAFRKIEQLHTSIKSNGQVSNDIFLYIDFPRFDFPIIFSEVDYPPPTLALHSSTPQLAMKGVIEEGDGGQVCFVWDPEAIKDNPVESKHRRLVRSHRNGPLDRDLKPNPKIRDELNVFSVLLI
jgi:phosphatidylinositol 3-kinase